MPRITQGHKLDVAIVKLDQVVETVEKLFISLTGNIEEGKPGYFRRVERLEEQWGALRWVLMLIAGALIPIAINSCEQRLISNAQHTAIVELLPAPTPTDAPTPTWYPTPTGAPTPGYYSELREEIRALEKRNQELEDRVKELLEKLEKELTDLKAEKEQMGGHWKKEKEAISKIREIKEKLESTKTEAQLAERQGDLSRAAELKYGTLIALEKNLEQEKKNLDQLQADQRMLKEEVDSEDIAEVVGKWTGIPVSRLMEGEREKLLRMEDRLERRVIGQKKGIIAVANAVRRARSGLQDPNRPIGSFIFMGPTGVGKTELGRALAEFLFDDEKYMIRLDMSEYMEKHSVARLIGAPPGYVGYEEGGQLTEAVRRHPYSVVLFDEIEKAHPDVFNALLQILDDGRMTDGKGRTVDFKNTVIIMTSNVGSQWIYELAGKDNKEMETRVMEALRSTFRPEFLNRVDEIVIFNSLGTEEIKRIVDIQIAYLSRRLEGNKITLALTDRAREFLAKTGFDPVYGARPLKRTIQQRIQNPLAVKILDGSVKDGDRVTVDVEKGEVVFRIK